MTKIKIIDFSIRYSKQLASNKREAKAELETKVSDIKHEINRVTLLEEEEQLNELYSQLNKSEAELNSFISSEIQGIITRARIQWVEEGERSTKYFLGLEKSAQKKKSITKLVTESSEI